MKIKFDLPMLKTGYTEFENSILTIDEFSPLHLSKEKDIISLFMGAKECAEIFFQDDVSITEGYLSGVGLDSEEFTKKLVRHMYMDPAKADAVRTYANRPFNEVIPESEMPNNHHEYRSKSIKNKSVTCLAFYENELRDFAVELEENRISNDGSMLDLVFGAERDVSNWGDFEFAINMEKFTKKLDEHLPQNLINRTTNTPTLEEKISTLLDTSEHLLDDMLVTYFDVNKFAREMIADSSYMMDVMDRYGYLGVYRGSSPLFKETTNTIFVFLKSYW